MEKTAVVNGLPLHYRVFGSGPPVLLIHGFGEDGTVWDAVRQYLPKTFRYLVPDLPGSGGSLLPESAIEPSIDYLADSITRLIDQEFPSSTQNAKPVPSVACIGHSMGGYVALSVAERYPNLVSGLALVHSTAYADTEEKKANRQKSMAFIESHGAAAFLKETAPNLFGSTSKTNHPEIISAFINKYAGISAKTLIWYARAMRDRPDRSQVLQKLRVPAGFLIGLEDMAVPAEQSIRQAPLARYSYMKILDQTGHMGMLEAPKPTAAFLEQFLTAVALWKEPDPI